VSSWLFLGVLRSRIARLRFTNRFQICGKLFLPVHDFSSTDQLCLNCLSHAKGQVQWTLLFSREHYLASAEAFLRGIERRIEAGLNPNVSSVASIFISRWDAAVMSRVPETLRNRLGIAIAKRTYQAYCSLLSSERWRRAY